MAPPRRRLGEVLLEQRVVTRAQLEQALQVHQRTRQRLGQVLVDGGVLTEAQLVAGLGVALGVGVLNLRELKPHPAALKLLKVTFCEAHTLFPCGFETAAGRKRLVVAMADPLNLSVLEELKFLTGGAVSVRLATPTGIRGAIAQHYHGIAPGAELDGSAEEFVILSSRPEPPPAAPGKASAAPDGSMHANLAYLTGAPGADPEVHALRHDVRALMRLLVRKGLVTPEELREALSRPE